MNKTISIFLVCLLLFSVVATPTVTAQHDIVESIDKDLFYQLTGMPQNPINYIQTIATQEEQPTFNLNSRAAILIDGATGEVLYEYNSDEKRPIASITKVMTMILVSEALEQGKITKQSVVTASRHVAEMGGSQIWIEEGEQFTVDELMKAVAIGSANDAAVALAEYVSGSEEQFVVEMNKKAVQLGMTDTTFMNSNGLDEDGHISSARDAAKMARELLNHEYLREYTSMWTEQLRGGETQLVNTNKLLKQYDDVTGVKTGTTSKAGVCVAVSALREDMELIAVVLGADSSTLRNEDASKLLDYGFANFEIAKLEPPSGLPESVRVILGEQETCSFEAKFPNELLLKKGTKDTIKLEAVLVDSVNAPVEQGTQLGEIVVLASEQEIGRYPIVANETIAKMSFQSSLQKLLLQTVSFDS